MSATTLDPIAIGIDPIEKLTRDVRNAARVLSHGEARFLVDTYYNLQEHRIATGNQVRSLAVSDEPNETLQFVNKQFEKLENSIKNVLGVYADAHPVGAWARSITGIGPVIAAGLLAHIDIEHCPTAGHIWSFAGLDPTKKWLGTKGAAEVMGLVTENPHDYDPDDHRELISPDEIDAVVSDWKNITYADIVRIGRLVNRKPGNLVRLSRDENGRVTRTGVLKMLAKRPWNAKLKVLCWKAGESFIKVQNNPNDVYGKIFVERKQLEWERNLRGEFADQAAQKLATTKIGKTTEAYQWYSGQYQVRDGFRWNGNLDALKKALTKVDPPMLGMLPPDHINARARRYAVKLFLAHFHEVYYRHHFGTEPPAPYPIAFLGHAHKIEVPNLGE